MTEQHPKNLWAPWRMEYIAGLANNDGGSCFLCQAHAQSAADPENHVLWRGPQSLVMLNRFPYSSGHALVAPARHLAELEGLPDALLLELMQQVRGVKRVLQAALGAQGFNIGINIGRCAGAGLPEHLHVHVVPRWGGDTNFMAVLGDVRVIPQALAEVRRLCLEAARQLGLGPAPGVQSPK